MLRHILRNALAPIAIGIAAAVLAGCATDARYKEGVNWVVYNEREKARLQAQGFPQYERD